MDIRKDTDGNTIIGVTLMPHLHQCIDHPVRKINKKTLSLNFKFHQMNKTDMYRKFHPKPVECFTKNHTTFRNKPDQIGKRSIL